MAFHLRYIRGIGKRLLGLRPETHCLHELAFRLTSQGPQLWSPSWLPDAAVLGSAGADQPVVISAEGGENGKADGEVVSVLVVWWQERWFSIRNQVSVLAPAIH